MHASFYVFSYLFIYLVQPNLGSLAFKQCQNDFNNVSCLAFSPSKKAKRNVQLQPGDKLMGKISELCFCSWYEKERENTHYRLPPFGHRHHAILCDIV